MKHSIAAVTAVLVGSTMSGVALILPASAVPTHMPSPLQGYTASGKTRGGDPLQRTANSESSRVVVRVGSNASSERQSGLLVEQSPAQSGRTRVTIRGGSNVTSVVVAPGSVVEAFWALGARLTAHAPVRQPWR